MAFFRTNGLSALEFCFPETPCFGIYTRRVSLLHTFNVKGHGEKSTKNTGMANQTLNCHNWIWSQQIANCNLQSRNCGLRRPSQIFLMSLKWMQLVMSHGHHHPPICQSIQFGYGKGLEYDANIFVFPVSGLHGLSWPEIWPHTVAMLATCGIRRVVFSLCICSSRASFKVKRCGIAYPHSGFFKLFPRPSGV